MADGYHTCYSLVCAKIRKLAKLARQTIGAANKDDISANLKNNIVVFGSCRLGALAEQSYIHKIHHTHNTKEVIQYIEYISGNLDIDKEMNKYVFRSCFLNNKASINRRELKSELDSADIVFIELCSRKKYTKNGYYIHHLAADKGDAHGNNLIEESYSNECFDLEIQDKKELAKDILTITNKLRSKIVVIVTHVDCGIENRRSLIHEVLEICGQHHIICVNPSDRFSILQKEMLDSNHYSPKGLVILARYVLQKFEEYSNTPGIVDYGGDRP